MDIWVNLTLCYKLASYCKNHDLHSNSQHQGFHWCLFQKMSIYHNYWHFQRVSFEYYCPEDQTLNLQFHLMPDKSLHNQTCNFFNHSSESVETTIRRRLILLENDAGDQNDSNKLCWRKIRPLKVKICKNESLWLLKTMTQKSLSHWWLSIESAYLKPSLLN